MTIKSIGIITIFDERLQGRKNDPISRILIFHLSNKLEFSKMIILKSQLKQYQ